MTPVPASRRRAEDRSTRSPSAGRRAPPRVGPAGALRRPGRTALEGRCAGRGFGLGDPRRPRRNRLGRGAGVGRRGPEGRSAPEALGRPGPPVEGRDLHPRGPARGALGRHGPGPLPPDARPADARPRRRSGLPDSYVYWVGEDREGYVWAGTNRGAARIAPSGEIRVFTTNDGLGANECNKDGFFCDRRGASGSRRTGSRSSRGSRPPGARCRRSSPCRRSGWGGSAFPRAGRRPPVEALAPHAAVRRPLLPRRGRDDVPLPARRALGLVDRRRAGAGRDDLRGPRGRELRLRGDGDDGRRRSPAAPASVRVTVWPRGGRGCRSSSGSARPGGRRRRVS